MLRDFRKLMARLSHPGAMQRLHRDTYTENKINALDATLLSVSADGELFYNLTELDGYHFFDLIVLSRTEIKTIKGARLELLGTKPLHLVSDTREIESDYSNVSNRFITEISFHITKAGLDIVRLHNFTDMVLSWRKNRILRFEEPNE